MVLFAFIVMFLLGGPAQAEDLTNVKFLACYDADTCRFDILPSPALNTDLRIRFSGIDAPEILGKCQKEKDLAVAARDFVRDYLQGANSVILKNVSRDMYYRIDATVTADGVNLNQLLIEKGYAVAYSGTGKRHDWCGP